MPPIRTEKAKKLIEQEGRILLAISTYKKYKFTSIAKTAEVFEPSFYPLRLAE